MLGANEHLVVGIVADDGRGFGKNIVGWVVVVSSSLSPTLEMPSVLHGGVVGQRGDSSGQFRWDAVVFTRFDANPRESTEM